MNPFDVLKVRGHILGEDGDSGFNRVTTHSGLHDDYDQARGPSRSLTARSDKKMQTRDYRMPVDLARSRRVGLTRTVCPMCFAVRDQGFTQHERWCPAAVAADRPDWKKETTGPMLPNETSADVGWH